MKSYEALIAADIYRDGGSLEARFQLQDGTYESLWLSILPWGYPAEASYGTLRVSIGADGAEHGRSVPKGSEEESEIIQGLTTFLERPNLNVPFSHRTEDQHLLWITQRILSEIPNRIGDPLSRKQVQSYDGPNSDK